MYVEDFAVNTYKLLENCCRVQSTPPLFLRCIDSLTSIVFIYNYYATRRSFGIPLQEEGQGRGAIQANSHVGMELEMNLNFFH
jgi:hypothetical protein